MIWATIVFKSKFQNWLHAKKQRFIVDPLQILSVEFLCRISSSPFRSHDCITVICSTHVPDRLFSLCVSIQCFTWRAHSVAISFNIIMCNWFHFSFSFVFRASFGMTNHVGESFQSVNCITIVSWHMQYLKKRDFNISIGEPRVYVKLHHN